jgi:hypothetical protein
VGARQRVTLHGLVYGLADGILNDLGVEANSMADMNRDYVAALARYGETFDMSKIALPPPPRSPLASRCPPTRRTIPTAGQGHRAVLARRRGRRADAHRRAEALRAPRPAGRRREQAGRGRDARRGRGREGGADGYTLLLASQTNAISATMYRKLPFDPIEDFAPVMLIGEEPGVLVVHPSFPAKTLDEFIAYVKDNPGKVDYASSGNGSGQHLFAAMFASMAGLKMNHVPYKGSAQATTDLLGGTGAGVDPRHRRHDGPHQGRQAPRARDDRLEARRGAARAARDRRALARLRSVRVARHPRAEGHAAARSSTSSRASSRP